MEQPNIESRPSQRKKAKESNEHVHRYKQQIVLGSVWHVCRCGHALHIETPLLGW